MPMPKEQIKAIIYGVTLTLITAGLIVAGSHRLKEFDAALVGYTFAVLFAIFGLTYRYTMWLQRPPTALYWRRGWQVFFKPQYLITNLTEWFKRITGDFAFNHFIYKRGKSRWAAHFLIMWGCLIAVAITFPLVFGWVHFETVPNAPDTYITYVFGIPGSAFKVHSLLGFLIFHGLVWASLMVIPGVMLVMKRRVSDHEAAATQTFGEDFLPLILLFAISMTGLMLTASYTWMKGYGYDFLAILHAITVIFTLLWMPFGKFFHIFQRPAQLGVSFYKDVGEREGMAHCHRCNEPYASKLHVEDLIEVEKQLGYRYELDNGTGEHYQHICPRCRRAMLVLAQGRIWHGQPEETRKPAAQVAD